MSAKESIKVYRKYSRLINQFPKLLQPKLKYNLKEAFDLNKHSLRENLIQEQDINDIIEKANKLYIKFFSMSQNQDLFSQLFKPALSVVHQEYKYESVKPEPNIDIKTDHLYLFNKKNFRIKKGNNTNDKKDNSNNYKDNSNNNNNDNNNNDISISNNEKNDNNINNHQ